ncbi:MAG TPA: hypothetical protein VGL86_11860 [Polyangia bacterium]|jgi:hypothetical protein
MTNGAITGAIAAASLVVGSVLAIPWWRHHRIETLNHEVELVCGDDALELRNAGDAKTVTLEDVWENDHGTKPARKIERLGAPTQIAIAAKGTARVALVAVASRCAAPWCWTMVRYAWNDDDDVLISGTRECVRAAPATPTPPLPATPTR